MGDPLKMDGLFHGKSKSKIDDDWGYPHFRKHSYIIIYIYATQLHTQLGDDFCPPKISGSCDVDGFLRKKSSNT
jgi:hypothetical protein